MRSEQQLGWSGVLEALVAIQRNHAVIWQKIRLYYTRTGSCQIVNHCHSHIYISTHHQC